jgi:hypothetical protein
MRDSHSHEEKNSKPYYFDDLLRATFNFLKKTSLYLLSMDVEKKKAISLTLIIMTLSFFLGWRNVFLLNHILCISSDDYYIEYFSYSGLRGYIVDYLIFLIVWSPAIYLLRLYWNSKTLKFRLSVAYTIGLLTYRFTHNEWGLYDFDNFVTCFGIATLFTGLTAALIYFVNGVKE